MRSQTAPRAGRGRRWIYIAAALACVGAIAFLVFGGLRGNIVYFRTVSEAVKEQDSGRLRLAGEVVPGTVVENEDGVIFEVTDGTEAVEVIHRGDPPDLFAEGAPVVAEGEWDDEFTTFQSDRILINHGNEYSPPEVDADDEPSSGTRTSESDAS